VTPLPVVWIPEANEDLLEARGWYDNIRPELGHRFALAIEATVEAIAEHPMQFPVVYRGRRRAGVRYAFSAILIFLVISVNGVPKTSTKES
jgi:plasmid stabilization system protein ParE